MKMRNDTTLSTVFSGRTIENRIAYIAYISEKSLRQCKRTFGKIVIQSFIDPHRAIRNYNRIRAYWPFCESLYAQGSHGMLKKEWRSIAAEQIAIAKLTGECEME